MNWIILIIYSINFTQTKYVIKHLPPSFSASCVPGLYTMPLIRFDAVSQISIRRLVRSYWIWKLINAIRGRVPEFKSLIPRCVFLVAFFRALYMTFSCYEDYSCPQFARFSSHMVKGFFMFYQCFSLLRQEIMSKS